MNINKSFPSAYIKASDLNGRAVTVTIRDVKVEQIGRDRDEKPVLYFEGKQKGLVLNKTNARKIATLLGSMDTDDWAGYKIAIFPSETEFSGETVECIRVKAAEPPRASRPTEEEFDSDQMPQPPPAAARPSARHTSAPSTIDDSDVPFY